MTFAKRLFRAMVAVGMQQKELAMLADVQISTISRLLNGHRRHPDFETLVALAQVLGVSTDYLCGLKEITE